MLKPYMRLTISAIAVTLASTGLVYAATPNGVAGTFGTTGLGIELSRQLSKKIRVRGLLSTMSLGVDRTEDNIEYQVDIGLGSLGAVLDIHPAANGFRLSLGLAATNPALDLKSVTSQTNYEIGGNSYSGDVSINGTAKSNSMAPVFAVGWSTNQTGSGLYVSGDLGFMYVGDPKLTAVATGSNVTDQNGNTIDITSSTQFQSDLERERQSLENDLSGFNIFPLFVLGIGYRF